MKDNDRTDTNIRLKEPHVIKMYCVRVNRIEQTLFRYFEHITRVGQL